MGKTVNRNPHVRPPVPGGRQSHIDALRLGQSAYNGAVWIRIPRFSIRVAAVVMAANLLACNDGDAPSSTPGPAGGPGEIVVAVPADGDWSICHPELPECEYVRMHGSMEYGPSDIMVRAPAGYRLPLVKHRFTDESQVVVSGALIVSGTDGIERRVPAGGFRYIPADTPHSTRCSEESDCLWYEHREGPFDVVVVDRK